MNKSKANISVPPNFGLWVKNQRRILGLTQKELIAKLHPFPSARTIKNIESGKKFVFREGTLISLADGLEIDITEMMQIIEHDSITLKKSPYNT